MSLVLLTIDRISYSQNTNGAYALLLSEKNGQRKLPVVIGGFEAQSIAVALEKEIKPSRPLTHDLFKNFASCFEVKIKKVVIYKLIDGVFFSNLICEKDEVEKIIDARTSDSIAMALRFEAPIFIYDSIMKIAGFTAAIKTVSKKSVSLDNLTKIKHKSVEKNKLPDNMESLSLSELKNILKKLVDYEEYEKAVKVRDIISKKNI